MFFFPGECPQVSNTRRHRLEFINPVSKALQKANILLSHLLNKLNEITNQNAFYSLPNEIQKRVGVANVFENKRQQISYQKVKDFQIQNRTSKSICSTNLKINQFLKDFRASVTPSSKCYNRRNSFSNLFSNSFSNEIMKKMSKTVCQLHIS